MPTARRPIPFGATILGLAALAVIAVAGMARAPSAADARVSIEQVGDADLRVTYAMKKPRRELIFRAVEGGYRARRWTIETPGFRLLRLDGEDRIVRLDGKRFGAVTVAARPDLVHLPKDYQPVVRYGDGGALVYTGHFWPVTARGSRVNATFDLRPAPGGQTVAFGKRAPALEDWRSPMAHPAFVYMGPLAPIETDHVVALVDPETPAWIVEELHALTADAFDFFANAFGYAPEPKPTLFLAVGRGRDPNRFRFSGDALPGQFQITLEGAAWREPGEEGRRLFRRLAIHEAFHLWQSVRARPLSEDVAGWIHEGGAEAAAAEAMLALGYWDAAAFEAFRDGAKQECADGLEDGPLARAHERGAFRALYDCGFLIAEAAARADGGSVTDFWRDFMDDAYRRGGYSEDHFYDFVAARTGDRAFARKVRGFVQAPLADPAREIDRLASAAASTRAGAPTLAPPLAPENRR